MKKIILLLLLLLPAVGYAKMTVDQFINDKWVCTKQYAAEVYYELNPDDIVVYYPEDTVKYHIYSITEHKKTGAGEISTFNCGECNIMFVSHTSGHHMLYIEYKDKRIAIL